MRIYPNRNPSRRRRRIEWSLAFFGGLALQIFNSYFIINGILTGSIKALRRGSRAQIRFDAEPGWYLFNISSRVVVFILFTWGLVLIWKALRDAFRK